MAEGQTNVQGVVRFGWDWHDSVVGAYSLKGEGEFAMMGAMVLTLLGGLWLLTLHVSASGSFPRPLTAKQERECLERMKAGDRSARGELVEHNLRLVAHIVKKYYAVSGEQDDLISIGTIGLIKAVESYDMNKKTRFATYAARCIENEILMYFRGKRKTAGDLSLDDPIDTDRDGNSLTLMELVSDEEDIISQLDMMLQAEKLRSVFGLLEQREQKVLRLRYGLNNRPPMTQREIARKLNISRSYVSRLEKHAIERLREEMTK